MPGEAELISQAAGRLGGITLGAAQTISGLINAGKTKKEAAMLKKTRPKLGRDQLADETLAFTKSELAQGMSAKANQAYNDIADRDFSSSLSAILKGGGNLNSIGDIYGSKEEGRQRLAIMKDNLRLSQIQNEVSASRVVSNRNDEQFQYNIDAPWKDAAQANAAAREKSQQQIWGGLQSITGAAMQNSQSKSEATKFGLKDPSEISGLTDYNRILGLGNKAQPIPLAQPQPLGNDITPTSIYQQFLNTGGNGGSYLSELYG